MSHVKLNVFSNSQHFHIVPCQTSAKRVHPTVIVHPWVICDFPDVFQHLLVRIRERMGNVKCVVISLKFDSESECKRLKIRLIHLVHGGFRQTLTSPLATLWLENIVFKVVYTRY